MAGLRKCRDRKRRADDLVWLQKRRNRKRRADDLVWLQKRRNRKRRADDPVRRRSPVIRKDDAWKLY
ncbi:hypothetical protein D7X48_08435 [bacterium D16-50]|nr:hypothetical protein D7X48_08435 [bacterium D16-50]